MVMALSMSKDSWGNTTRQLGHAVEMRFDTLRYNLKKRLKYDQPLQIVPYNGFGNEQALFIKGRVLEDKGDLEQSSKESLWNNLVAAYQRFESDEVPGLQLNAFIQGAEYTTQTDEEGYFTFNIPTPNNLDTTELWHDIRIEVPAQAMLAETTPAVTGKIMLPAADCDFGIISDIDDTIMLTQATSLLAMARLTFTQSPASRLPFEGVADFYNALTRGNATSGTRPIFYVSSSPWNLYDFLIEFMEINRIPVGPLMLRDFGLNSEQLFQSSHHKHKLAQINKVMSTYPDLPFILIGDSGQHDPEIYAEIVAARPQQVKAIYIRDVSPAAERDTAIQEIAAQVKAQGIDMLLVADTQAAAEHAVAQGYISSLHLLE